MSFDPCYATRPAPAVDVLPPALRFPLTTGLVSHGPCSPQRSSVEEFVRREFLTHFGARLRQFMPELLGLHGPDGSIRHCNRALAELLGTTPESAAGRDFYALARGLPARSLDGGVPGSGRRMEVDWPRGERTYRVAAHPAPRLPEGAIVVVATDVTEQRRLHDLASEAAASARAAEARIEHLEREARLAGDDCRPLGLSVLDPVLAEDALAGIDDRLDRLGLEGLADGDKRDAGCAAPGFGGGRGNALAHLCEAGMGCFDVEMGGMAAHGFGLYAACGALQVRLNAS